MKKIMIIILAMTMLVNAQVFRSAESGSKQRKIEYLQGGILLRFDFIQTERIDMDGKSLMWKYQEFWIPLNMAISGIQKYIGEKGYSLAVDEIEYLQGLNSLETETYWQIETIQFWLADRGVEYPADATKDELQSMVKSYLVQ